MEGDFRCARKVLYIQDKERKKYSDLPKDLMQQRKTAGEW
jgi:hypothetical protein